MLNRVILMGRLTADPDYRTTQSGTTMARFTLAVERDFSGQQGERQTDFLDVLAWRGTADFVSKYFHKGQLVAVQGRIQVSDYTDREGKKRKSWDIVADQVYFAESRRSDGDNQNGHNQPARKNVNVEYEGSYDAMTGFAPVNDDDLPF